MNEWEAQYYTAATFKKTRGEGYDIHIAATVTDEDGGTYVLSYDEEPLTPTGETIAVDFTTAMDKPSRISDGSWFLRATNYDYSVQMGYYSDDESSPAGEYAINNSHVEGTVSLSEGMDFTGAVYYSFVGYADDMNRLSAAWFLVSGTVTVNEEGIITIEALNSKGKAVKCVLGDPNAVGIRQTVSGHTASPQKRIEQGRLVILKDGIRYNAIGMEVK